MTKEQAIKKLMTTASSNKINKKFVYSASMFHAYQSNMTVKSAVDTAKNFANIGYTDASRAYMDYAISCIKERQEEILLDLF